MKSLVISPTYNEVKNIDELIRQIHHYVPEIHILIVDDNSPDGTADRIKKIMETDEKLFMIQREGKLGLGTAYCAGFKWALEFEYERILQIDADLSHNPEDLSRLLERSHQYDLVIGSRYCNGVNVVNWPIRRLILSYIANVYARIITGMPVRDATGGFKCFHRKILKAIDLNKIKSEGYSFQIEMNYLSWIKGFSIRELPITFVDRTVGLSKMSKRIIFEAIFTVPMLKLKKIFRLL